MLKEIGSRKIEENPIPKPNLGKNEDKIKTKKVVCKDKPAEIMNMKRLTDLFDVTSARDCGKLSKSKITKPQPVYTSITADTYTEPVAGPAHQWEMRCGKVAGQGRPQSQKNEQK